MKSVDTSEVPRRIVVTARITVKVYWVPEDFEGSDETWKEFVQKMKDSTYAKEAFLDNVLDWSTDDIANWSKVRTKTKFWAKVRKV